MERYQNCLIPEGNELTIFEKKGKLEFYEAENITEKEKVYDILYYDKKRYMNNFYSKKKDR